MAAMAAQVIFLIIGYLVSLILFISPVPTFIYIINKGRTERFSVNPYVAICANSIVWMLYGLPSVQADSLPLAVINGIGVLVGFVYVIIFLWHSRLRQSKCALICICFAIAFVVFVIVVVIWTTPPQISFVGTMGIASGIFMYAAPFTPMQRACRTNSVDYMPFLLSLSLVLNGIGWFTYGLIVSDGYIMIAHGAGSLLGVVQLIVWVCVAGVSGLANVPVINGALFQSQSENL